MRVLRSSIFNPATLLPLTTVVRDSDIRDTLESARMGILEPGYFVAFDLFEVAEDIDIVQATTAAMLRMEDTAEDERNQALQFYWATAQFQLVSKDGAVIMPEPAPLSEHQIRVVFDAILKHPDYTNQTLIATSKDGVQVTIKNGEVQS